MLAGTIADGMGIRNALQLISLRCLCLPWATLVSSLLVSSANALVGMEFAPSSWLVRRSRRLKSDNQRRRVTSCAVGSVG